MVYVCAGTGEDWCQRAAGRLTWERSGTVSLDIKSTPH